MNIIESQVSVSDQKAVLKAFSRAVHREANVIDQNPDLFWQQMYNRLQWEKDVDFITKSLLIDRTKPEFKPWVKIRHPYRESKALIQSITGHSDRITACAISPDSRWFVTGSWDNSLKIWDLATGSEIRTLLGHKAYISDCAISPDGTRIVSADRDGTLKIWEPISGKEIHSIDSQEHGAYACAISPDNTWFVSTGGYDLKIWNLSSGSLLKTLKGHTHLAFDCAISPDGTWIVSVSGDKTIKIWDVGSGKILKDFVGHEAGVNCCAISPDGKRIISGSDDHTLKIWDVETGQELSKLSGHEFIVEKCAYYPDGKGVISVSTDSTVILWKHQRIILRGHTAGVDTCAISPSGKRIVSGGADNTIKIWDATVQDSLPPLPGHSGKVYGDNKIKKWTSTEVTNCSFFPDGKKFVSSGLDNTIRIWETETGKELQVLTGHSFSGVNNEKGGVTHCVMSRDGKYFVSAGKDRRIKIWNAMSGECLRTIVTWDVSVLAISPDGKWVLASESNIIKYNIPSGKTLREFQGRFICCQVSPDGKWIASVSYNSPLNILDSAKLKNKRSLNDKSDETQGCAFSPDGRNIVHFGTSPLLIVRNVENGEIIITFNDHSGPIKACSFSPDGHWIATASEDRTVKIFDINTGNKLFNIPLLGTINCLAFHPTQPLIVCGDTGGSLYFIDLIGKSYDGLLVTAIEQRSKLEITCPSCMQVHNIKKKNLASEFSCPTPSCGQRLRINPFSIK